MKTKTELIEEVLRLDGFANHEGITESTREMARLQLKDHAHDMVRIIRAQQEQIELLVEALEYEESRDDYGISDKSADVLAKIESGEWLEASIQHNTKYEG